MASVTLQRTIQCGSPFCPHAGVMMVIAGLYCEHCGNTFMGPWIVETPHGDEAIVPRVRLGCTGVLSWRCPWCHRVGAGASYLYEASA